MNATRARATAVEIVIFRRALDAYLAAPKRWVTPPTTPRSLRYLDIEQRVVQPVTRRRARLTRTRQEQP